MYDVYEDADNPGCWEGSDGNGSSARFEPDSHGDYISRTDSGGYSVIETKDGETVAYRHTYD